MNDELIRTENLYKIYETGGETIYAVHDVSLSIERSDFVVFMGHSGSGKTTLMNAISCLDKPTKGHYYLKGKDVSQLEDDALAEIRNKEIGFVFQTFNLLSKSTALDNVALPLIYAGDNRQTRYEKALAALASVGLEQRAMHKPAELSGGQRQRVAIARALVNNPSLIIADEPTGNLDSKSSIEIMAIFEELHKQGNTIIMVTHEDNIAEYGHRVVWLEDGKVISDKRQR